MVQLGWTRFFPEMFIWSALQNYMSLHFRQLLWIMFDVKKLSQKSIGRIPQNKLSQISLISACSRLHVTSFIPNNSLFSRITYFEEPILKLTPLNALLDFFLPSMDSRLIRFKSSMVTLLADSQSILSCSNAAFFTSSSFFSTATSCR